MTAHRLNSPRHSAPQTRIWDLPTRLFHWLFAFSICGALLTINLGGAWMEWHVRFGIASFVLLLFRLIWGLIGPRYARFAQFMTSPAQTISYLRQKNKSRHAGHNPLGAWSVIAMLILLLFQSFSGLFTNDDVLTQGPLVQFVSNDTVALFTRLHLLNEYLLYALILLHLLAIAFYSFKGESHVKPMMTGDIPKHTLPPDAQNARDDWRVRAGALLLSVLLTGLGWWLYKLAVNAPASFS